MRLVYFEKKIVMLGGGGLVEFDAEFKFAKIQNCHVEGGGGLMEFDAEFKFAKIQMFRVGGRGAFDAKFACHVEGGAHGI